MIKKNTLIILFFSEKKHLRFGAGDLAGFKQHGDGAHGAKQKNN